MAFKYLKNLFSKGINADLDKSQTPPDQYLDAHNLLLTEGGKFLVAQNLSGTTEAAQLGIALNGNVLGLYAATYTKLSDSTTFPALTAFFYKSSDSTLNIVAVDLTDNSIYRLYSEFIPEFGYGATSVDAVLYPENGVDVLYFTDNFRELRKLRCEIPISYTPNFLKPQQLSLQRRAAIANISLEGVNTEGGTLLCGSYQFSIRFYNSLTQTYTKWTVPGAPINVSKLPPPPDSPDPSTGFYGLATTKRIVLRVDVPTSEYTLYDQVQVAVIENTSGVIQTVASLNTLTTPTFSDVTAGFKTFYYTYESNRKIDTIQLSDIVVDTAAIQNLKTLQVKNNRLFGGGIRYFSLSYDHGNPTVTGTVTKRQVINTSDSLTSSYRGYFRDEVYRFYVVYFDQYYNLSRPYKLDMSAITANQAAGTHKDMKFPARGSNSIGGVWYGSLLDPTNKAIALGLTLNVTNHPSWARGFMIYRAKRKENVIFQTPVVPMVQVDGILAISDYPVAAQEANSTGAPVAKAYPLATPMNPLGTLVTKNLFFVFARPILRRTKDAIPNQKGEVSYINLTAHDSVALFDNTTYDPTASTPLESLNLTVVDYANLKLNYNNSTDSTAGTAGDTIDTSVAGNFYATGYQDYYFASNASPAALSGLTPVGTLPHIVASKPLDNYGVGTSLSGSFVGQFPNLQTPGVTWWVDSNNQKMVAAKLDHTLTDAVGLSSAIPAGLYETFGTQTNNLVFTKPAYSPGTYVNAVNLANVNVGLMDDRYGTDSDRHDMVFTGAMYVFSDTELTTVQLNGSNSASVTVFGGDCYVSLHQFKLSDNNYFVSDYQKANGTEVGDLNTIRAAQLARWNRIYNNKFDVAGVHYVTCMPMGVKNLSQVVSVMLESKYNGEVLGIAPYTTTIVDGRPLFTESNEFKWRIAFPYTYHLGYSQQSDQKVLIPYNSTEVVTTYYGGRVAYSDPKVYNTTLSGFDTFRIGSIYDLEETYGPITKLTLDGPDLIAVQEKGIIYIPVDANTVETSDGGTLSVRAGEVIGRPIYITKLYGSQHIKTVINQDNFIFMFDGANQAFLKLQAKKLELIHEKGQITDFSSSFTGATYTESDVFSFYDNNKRQIWFCHRAVETGIFKMYCNIYDDRLGVWVGKLDFSTNNPLSAGIFAHKHLYLVENRNLVSGELMLHTMYTGLANKLFTQTVTPSITFSINDDFDTPKTFDNIIVYASDKLLKMDLAVENESGLDNQLITDLQIDPNRREGNYRIPTLRDVNLARLRGTRAMATIYWPPSGIISLSQVVTKYRPSARSI